MDRTLPQNIEQIKEPLAGHVFDPFIACSHYREEICLASWKKELGMVRIKYPCPVEQNCVVEVDLIMGQEILNHGLPNKS